MVAFQGGTMVLTLPVATYALFIVSNTADFGQL